MRRLSIIFSALALFGCGFSAGTDQTVENTRTSDEWEYEYSVNGCSTGVQRGEGKDSYCKALLDDVRNNNCARSMRITVHAEKCE